MVNIAHRNIVIPDQTRLPETTESDCGAPGRT